MYCCGTRKSHPQTRIISSETRQSLISDELFWSSGGASSSHNNTILLISKIIESLVAALKHGINPFTALPWSYLYASTLSVAHVNTLLFISVLLAR